MACKNIPKKIHYCWFGGNPLPDIAKKCIESWKLYCPNYEIICWNESNCDFSINLFVKQAAEHKKWAFVSDYFRLKVIEEHGGIYLDIDVELLKPLDNLLACEGFMGFELSDSNCINTGLGFGAVSGNEIIKKLMSNYENICFVKNDGSFDMTPCPKRDTQILVGLGLKQNNKTQMIGLFKFFSADYFSPVGFTGEQNFSENTYSIHHFNGSWLNDKQLQQLQLRKKIRARYGKVLGEYVFKVYYAIEIIRTYGVIEFCVKLFNKVRNN